MSVSRTAIDPYDGRSNYCDLPELPSHEREQQMSSMNLFRSKNLTSIAQNMVYNEDLQMQLYLNKKVDVFKQSFFHLNNHT